MNEKSEPTEPLRTRGWRWAIWVLPFAFYALLSLVYLRPVWRTGGDHLPASADDPLFNLYVLKWAAHQIGLGLPDFWNAGFYYPTPGATAFSDHLIGPGAQLALFLQLIPNAVAGYNFLFLTAYLLTGFTTCWVLRRAGLGWAAALFAGWAFAYAPFRLSQSSHIQLLIAQWIPLTLWFWDRLWRQRTAKNGALFLLFYLVHLSGGTYLAYMIHIPMLVLALNRLPDLRWKEVVAPRSMRVLLPVGIVAATALVLLFLPYVRISRAQGLSRNTAEIWTYGSTLASYFTPEPSLLWFQPGVERLLTRVSGDYWPLFFRSENSMFAGFLPTILCLAGLIAWWRRFRDPAAPRLPLARRAVLWFLFAVSVAGYLRATLQTLAREVPGSHPHLQTASWKQSAEMIVIPLLLAFVLRRFWKAEPLLRWSEMDRWERGLAFSGLVCFALTHAVLYVPLMKVVPGLSGMRVPARFYFFFSLSLVWFAARGFDACLGKAATRRGRAVLAMLLLLGLGAELAARPLVWAEVPPEERFPPVYSWLAQQQDVRALLELPMTRDGLEAWPMYYSTLHWKPIANGFSGYEALSHAQLAEALRTLPDEAAFALLRRLGISHLLFRFRSQHHLRRLARWEEEYGPAGRGWVVLVYREAGGTREAAGSSPGVTRVYRLTELPASSQMPKRPGL